MEAGRNGWAVAVGLTVESPPEVVAFAVRLIHELMPQKRGVVVIERQVRLCLAVVN